jgi:hypothetical protein
MSEKFETTKDGRKLGKSDEILKDGKDDRGKDGSEDVSIEIESFSRNSPQLIVPTNHTRPTEPLNCPHVIFYHKYSFFQKLYHFRLCLF